jgi:predicted nucleotidyltransferase
VLREALKDIENAVAVAFIFGSVATGDEREHSDLDLFVVGTAGYSVVTERTRSVEDRLGRRVQVLYFEPEFRGGSVIAAQAGDEADHARSEDLRDRRRECAEDERPIDGESV